MSKFVTNMMHFLVPLTLILLVVYVVLLRFKFMKPFPNRDVLIVDNNMLLAVIGLLMGTSQVSSGELAHRLKRALSSGILAGKRRRMGGKRPVGIRA